MHKGLEELLGARMEILGSDFAIELAKWESLPMSIQVMHQCIYVFHSTCFRLPDLTPTPCLNLDPSHACRNDLNSTVSKAAAEGQQATVNSAFAILRAAFSKKPSIAAAAVMCMHAVCTQCRCPDGMST